MSATASPVVIVGAGPTGLALALNLARASIPVRLIERAQQPATTSRAIGIQARTLELLDLYGLADAFVELGHQGRAGNIYARSRRLVRLDLAPLSSRFPFILFIEQTETERLLSEALAKLDVHVERGVEMISFAQSSEFVTATLRGSDGACEIMKCDYLVGCDGAHSATRRGMGLEFQGKTFKQHFLLADLNVDWQLSDHEFHIFTSVEGLLAIFPMRHGHRLIAEIENIPPDKTFVPPFADIKQIVERRADMQLNLSGMRWSSYFQVNSRLTPHLQRDRVFLVGDAAHIHSPAGAQGMNTGIQDAFNLGWKLGFVVRGHASPKLLTTYEEERHPVESGVLRQTELLTRVVSLKSPFLRFFRNRIASRVTALPLVQRIARRTISEIAINYRAMAAQKWSIPHSGLKAGDRAPDCWLLANGDAEPARLHTLLDPTRFTLMLVRRQQTIVSPQSQPPIAFQPDDRVRVLIGTEVAGEGIEEKAYAADEDRFYLIRPDGYLSVVGPERDVQEAAAFLERLKRP